MPYGYPSDVLHVFLVLLLLPPLLLLLQAALKQLQQHHPYLMPYIDDGLYARITSLPLRKALMVVKMLDETGVPGVSGVITLL
jgi:hypothetical protein